MTRRTTCGMVGAAGAELRAFQGRKVMARRSRRPARSATSGPTRKQQARSPRSQSDAIPRAAMATRIADRLFAAGDAVPQPMGANAVNTIVYVHGIGNKPPASVLKCQWDTALFSTALGDRSRMAYWVNRDIYPTPLDETCASGDLVDVAGEMPATGPLGIRRASLDADSSLDDEIKLLTDDDVRRKWLAKVAAKLIAGTAVSSAEMRARDVRAKVLPVPEFLRELITRNLTKILLRDVNDFL